MAQSSNTRLRWVEKTTTIPWNLQPKSPKEVEEEPHPVAQCIEAHLGGKEKQWLPALFPLYAVTDQCEVHKQD